MNRILAALLAVLLPVTAHAGDGWFGHGSVVAKGVTFRVPAAGQVTFDAATIDSTKANDAPFRFNCDTSTDENICNYVNYTLRADLSADAFAYARFTQTTAAVAIANAYIVADYWAHASSATDIGGTVVGWWAEDITGAEAATTYDALHFGTGLDAILVASSGGIQFAHNVTIETTAGSGAGPNMDFAVAPGTGGTAAAGDYEWAYDDGASSGDDSDTVHTLNDTSQVLLDANLTASGLSSSDGVLELAWRPASGDARRAILITWVPTLNATADTAAIVVDADDVEAIALAAGVSQGGVDVTPAYSSTDDATAIRAAYIARSPIIAGTGIPTAFHIPTTGYVRAFNSAGGHVRLAGTAPSVSLCGTNPAVTAGSSDQRGSVLVGTGTITSCTITFATAYSTAPFCTVSSTDNEVHNHGQTTSTTTVVITAGASMAGDTVVWHCIE